MKQNIEKPIMYGCVAISLIAVLLVGFIYTKGMFNENKVQTQSQTLNGVMAARFTEFDKNKAIDFMDKNNDGMCDFCGMRIEDCIASGMLQCSMDPNSKIGLLGSTHKHADIKIYTQGKQINLADPKYWVRSSFIHVEKDFTGTAGNLLHIHAKGIDLNFFMESLDIKINNVKVYINGQLNSQGLEYSPKNKDTILITDSSNTQEVKGQLKTISSFSI